MGIWSLFRKKKKKTIDNNPYDGRYIAIKVELVLAEEFMRSNVSMEILNTPTFRSPFNIYKIDGLDVECEYLGKFTPLDSSHVLRLKSKNLPRLTNLDSLLFGRTLVDQNGNSVATIFRYLNTFSIK